jgi:hypothetical protein
MIALILTLQLGLSFQDLPGDSFARPVAPIVLRSGSSSNYPGALMIDEGALVRIAEPAGSTDASYVKVYVPQGFPVYVHSDFVEVDLSLRKVSVEGTRLNMRLLPATVGMVPVGQLDEGPHELQLLDVEGAWVRVLAPTSLPLHARRDEFKTVSSAMGASGWGRQLATREQRRRSEVDAFDATDPARIRDRRQEDRISQLNAAVLSDDSDLALEERAVILESLAAEAGRRDIAAAVERLQQELTSEFSRREVALETLAEIERQRVRDAASLIREARSLDFGLRFLGKGDRMKLEGLVTRQMSEDTEAAVYSIQGPIGRTFKLSASKDVADLKALFGKRVILEGRSLSLVNVRGPVLIVDSVVSVSSPR